MLRYKDSTGAQEAYFRFTFEEAYFNRLWLLEPLDISCGGTGAGTAEDALSNLGAAPSNHNHDSKYLKKYPLNAIDIDDTDGCWTVDISEEGHGTIPTPWVNVTQTTSGHFRVQTAIKCNKDDNTSRKASGMWIRDKYISGEWSAWTGVALE